ETTSGLSEDEINKMVKEAEENAGRDKEAREVAEARNEADSLTYSLEKAVADAGDKVDPADKERAEDVVKRTREALSGDDVEAIKAARDEIQKVSMELGQKLYEASQAGQGADASNGAGEAGAEGQEESGEKVVDADYTVVDDEKK
ncbi:MAG: Hsp70 family protein, partial [Leptospiraceae bacterium]|nr:Hsp70 family protein [Leptospiraceae bacterium]